VAGIASLIIPGLGQALAWQFQRGLLLFGSLITGLGLFAWRVNLLATREVGALAKFNKALSWSPFFVLPTLVGLIALWLWIAWDAYQQAQPDRRGGIGVFALVIVLFFVLGWQVSEIDPYKAVTELADAKGPLSRVLWPWSAAFMRDTEATGAGADILAPCDELPPPEPPEETPGQPYLVADPTCGDLARQAEEEGALQTIPGTPLTIVGWGFEPNAETEIWWADPIGNEFRMRKEGEYIVFQTDAEGAFEIEITMPYRLIPPSAEGRQIHRVEARQTTVVGGLKPSPALRHNIEKMVETIVLGMMATLFGIVFSIPVSFLAARNLMGGSPVTMALYYITRTILNIVRSIEPLI
jgi:phosphonate transport system permease protein